MVLAPSADRLPAYPVSWYLFGRVADLRRRPAGRDMLGRRLVAYLTSTGQPVVLDARCSHLGSDLGKGDVVGDCIRCPFHHWQYGPDGHCTRLPSGRPAPSTARQASYPVAERHGLLFFFNGPEPLFPLPFFPDYRPEDYVPARPFYFHLNCPWFLIGANSVDLQHFRSSHDRELIGELSVSRPDPFACRVKGTYRVNGGSLRDRLIRTFGGPDVTLDTTDWCGNLIFTSATLRRTRSQGMVSIEPKDGGVRITVIVYTRRGGLLGRLTGPIQRAIRRRFVWSFLSSDAERLDGARYNPLSLVEDDRLLAEYFRWLSVVAHGRPSPPAANCFLHSEEEVTA